ncbi:hypothetical protein PbJCM13498_39980 [Prolixibacter bellariivorans]|uniref:DUF1566 domain-containing protein n=3 Tax=Prolixibacter bellariivorans TaxID=314319 RepID=A0A5M4B4Q5_9BACT|nr:hypothetical protein PbJCM13498_39980 [Prolixibacter bellariivorans]
MLASSKFEKLYSLTNPIHKYGSMKILNSEKVTYLLLFGLLLFFTPGITVAQNVSVSDEPHSPDSTAVLDIYSNTKGLLIPRVDLVAPDDPVVGTKPVGLLVWNKTASASYPNIGLHYWDGSDWKSVSSTEYVPQASAYYISNATSYESADSILDKSINGLQLFLDQIAQLPNTPANYLTNIYATRQGAGLNETDGAYLNHPTATYISTATSLNEADSLLDNQLTTVTNSTATNSAALVNLNTRVTNNTNAIATNTSDISTNTSDISNLQTQVNNLTSNTSTQTEIDAVEAGAGLNADGTYSANSGATYIGTATSLNNADNLLDQAISSVMADVQTNNQDVTQLTQDVANVQQQATNIQAELDNTQAGAGLGTDGSYTANTGTNVITSATDLNNADVLLDQAVTAVTTTAQTNQSNISSLDTRVQTLENNTVSSSDFGAAGTVEANKAIVAGSDKSVSGFNKISTDGKVTVGATTQPEASAIMEVNSTTQGFLPPRMTLAQIDAIASPAEGLMVYCTSLHQPLYYNGSHWMTYTGRPAEIKVGNKLEGGIIFYINNSTNEVYVVAEQVFNGLEWGPTDQMIGATSTDGASNTSLINTALASNTTYAAPFCESYTYELKTDWYLPSQEEMALLYAAQAQLPAGFIQSAYYWTSTEVDASKAVAFDGSTGTAITAGQLKSSLYQFYAIRKFVIQ